MKNPAVASLFDTNFHTLAGFGPARPTDLAFGHF
jgi:hypothetical protein